MRALFTLLAITIIGGTAGCAHVPTLYAPVQPDGWSAQPISITQRFSSDAKLDPATLTPVGDEGYYLYILTKVGNWGYGTMRSYLVTHAWQPWGHSWLILESPGNRLECGLDGNFGKEKPDYGAGIRQKFKDGDPNRISYLWVMMSDGQLEIGNGGRTPTFAWRMPITKPQYELIHEHVINWKYGQIGVRTNNCVDMITEAAELAGINLIHRIRLTLPPDVKILWRTLHLWSDPQYRVLEYSTPDVLEVDLRCLARFGIGRDVTEWYKASDMAAPRSKAGKKAKGQYHRRAEDGG